MASVEGNKKYLRIGLTGGFGAGKSTVAKLFRELGAHVVDADALARERLKKGTEEHRQVAALFGEEVIGRDGEIDRRALAGRVFGDRRLLNELNRVIHPGVIREMEERLAAASEPVRMAVIPLLFEAGLAAGFDYVIAVRADRETVLRRVREKRQLSEEDIDRRRASQLPAEEKERRADFIIDNNGSIEQTRKQAALIWETLTGS
ncbi:MAG: dephospho-CoA kinase [PVC group bacterium]